MGTVKPETVEITAEMVLEFVLVPQPTAAKMAAYANRRLAGLLPVDARRETGIGVTTGSRYEKTLRILCTRYGLPAPPEATTRFGVPDFVAAGVAGRHQRYHVKRGVTSPDCSLCTPARHPARRRNTTMPMSEIFGPAEKLHAAIRRRAPQLAVSLSRDDGLRQVHVTYQNAEPRTVGWDGATYRWCAGPADQPLPADPERAADVIAEVLGARTSVVAGRPIETSDGEVTGEPVGMAGRWWVSVPEMSDAFQVEMLHSDAERGLWWGNQVVGRATRHARGRWSAAGRDAVPLPNTGAADELYPTAEAALVRARDTWRQRTVILPDALGEDYWIEPRPVAGVESLWLGRIHLGYVRVHADGSVDAFTTNDELLTPHHLTRQEGLLAVREAWRIHLRRILRITQQPR